MSNKKISALSSASTPLTGSEIVPINQSSVTDSVSVANLTAGRSVSASDYVMSTGNLVPSTAAKGINFTANTPASGMTSQLLNWYEEGTWTPNQGSGLTVVGTFSSSGTYTKVGKLVMVTFRVNGSTSIASSNGGAICTNLPFATETASSAPYFGSMANNSTGTTVGEAYINTVYSVSALTATAVIYGTITYRATS